MLVYFKAKVNKIIWTEAIKESQDSVLSKKWIDFSRKKREFDSNKPVSRAEWGDAGGHFNKNFPTGSYITEIFCKFAPISNYDSYA